jgi:hypothetical protein
MIRSLLVVVLITAFASAPAAARGVYQEPAEFVREAFGGKPPAPQVLWITDAIGNEVKAALGHPLSQRRMRYWRADDRSVWILDEIGKDEPITVGVTISQGRLDRVNVLVFRESRGDEVRYPAFTRQFTGAGLTPGGKLDRTIDGISGATLSVRALKGVAATALVLDRHARLQ